MRGKKMGLRSVGGRAHTLVLLGAAVVLGACSEHQTLMAPDDNQGEVTEIEIRNFEFSMPELHVTRGTTVRWRNTTDNYHTVTPNGHSYWSTWQTASRGETFEVTFDRTGAFPYYCNPHRSLGMMGTIIVE